ncbi:hypothetical protein [Tenacibaculum amylolyticum]|uniref:hypothetical protein n=1 Tax=Tenacibaculum amylolyticum TaxID=104269 RepID=UPI003893A0B8
MKKIAFVLAMCFCVFLLTGCIDTAKELEELKNDEQQINLIEPDETGEPDGGVPEEEG